MPIAVDACAAQHQGDRKEQQDRVAILAHPRKRGVALAVVAGPWPQSRSCTPPRPISNNFFPSMKTRN